MATPSPSDPQPLTTGAALQALAREVFVPELGGRRLSPGQRRMEIIAGAPVRAAVAAAVAVLMTAGSAAERVPDVRLAAGAVWRRAVHAWRTTR
jgi:hypothetical protein